MDDFSVLKSAPWVHFQSIDSTNTYLCNLDEAEIESGYTCSADVQTAGKGQMSRQWVSAPGGLYLSILFKLDMPPASWPLLTFAAALSIIETIQLYSSPIHPAIKWPNDVLIDRKKIAGILLESFSHSDPRVIIGLGLNVNNDLSDIQPHALFPSTSLKLITRKNWEISVIAKTLRNQIIKNFLLWRKNPLSMVSAYNQYAVSIGKIITLLYQGVQTTGLDMGINDSGHLQLQSENRILSIHSATVIEIEP